MSRSCVVHKPLQGSVQLAWVGTMQVMIRGSTRKSLLSLRSCVLAAVGCALHTVQAGANLSLLLISRAQPAALGLLDLLPGVVTVPFPAYTDAQLINILAAVSGWGQGPCWRTAVRARAFVFVLCVCHGVAWQPPRWDLQAASHRVCLRGSAAAAEPPGFCA